MKQRLISRRKIVSFLIMLSAIITICFITMNVEASSNNQYETHNETTNEAVSPQSDLNSVFTFTPISDTECDVRLIDKTATKAIIPEKIELDGNEYNVTVIAGNGFTSASKLELVRLPKSVKTIGANAFANCKALTSLTLPGVEIIGANAFAMTKMEYLIIPTSVTSVASTILRGANTKVYVRTVLEEGTTVPEGWVSNWNGSNKNQSVEFNSDFIPEVKYELVSSEIQTLALGDDVDLREGGYYVSGYQEFCTIDTDDYKEVYIPATYTGEDGVERPIIGIASSAFFFNDINKITIGYSEDSIILETDSFFGLNGDVITINREVILESEGMNSDEQATLVVSENVFSNSTVKTIILPNTLTAIGIKMFDGCENLLDIHFIEPKKNLSKGEETTLVDTLESTRKIVLPNKVFSIGQDAFALTHNILELYIPNSVKQVGANIINGWKSNQTVYVDYTSDDPVFKDLENWNQFWALGNRPEDTAKVVYKLSDTEYNITYNIDTEFHNNPDKYISSQGLELKPVIKVGYTFEGWYLDENFEKPIENISIGTTGDLNLYAKIIPNKYQIRYNRNKPNFATNEITGVMQDSAHTYEVDSPLNENVYSLIGWKFKGWNTKADGSGDSYFDKAIVNHLATQGITELYAQWEAEFYEIEYKSNRPNEASNPVTGSMANSRHTSDQLSNLSTNGFSLVGWKFTGWNTEENGSGTTYATSIKTARDTKLVLFAQWEAKSYEIEYKPNKPNEASNPVTGSMANSRHTSDQLSNLSTNGFSLVGWKFTGWNTEENGSGTTYATSIKTARDTKLVLFAQWEAKSYEIEYKPNKPNEASNPVTGSMANSRHTSDQLSNLSTNGFSLVGWKFTGWNTEENGSGTTYATSIKTARNETLKLYAQWEAKEFMITFDSNKPSNASHNVTLNKHSKNVKADAIVDFSDININLEGWSFKGWKKDGGTTFVDTTKFTVTADVTLYAQWKANTYTLKFDANLPVANSGLTNSLEEIEFKYDINIISLDFYTLVSWEMKYWLYNYQAIQNLESITSLPDNNGIILLTAFWQEKNISDCINNEGQYEIATATQLRNISTRSGYYYKLVGDINLTNWNALPTFNSVLDLDGHTITYKNEHLSTFTSYGFIIKNFGKIWNGKFKVYIRQDWANPGQPSNMTYVGGVAAENYGQIGYVYVLSTIGEGNDFVNDNQSNVDIDVRSNYQTVGGLVGINYSRIESCRNYASIAGSYNIGGIVGVNYENAKIYVCTNYGRIWYCSFAGNYKSAGGIAGLNHKNAVISNSNNLVIMKFAYRKNTNDSDYVFMARIVGWCHPTAEVAYCHGLSKPIDFNGLDATLSSSQLLYIKNSTDNIGKVSETLQS